MVILGYLFLNMNQNIVPNHEDSIINIDKEKISLQGMYELDTGYFDQVSFNVTQGDYSHSEDASHPKSF